MIHYDPSDNSVKLNVPMRGWNVTYRDCEFFVKWEPGYSEPGELIVSVLPNKTIIEYFDGELPDPHDKPDGPIYINVMRSPLPHAWADYSESERNGVVLYQVERACSDSLSWLGMALENA